MTAVDHEEQKVFFFLDELCCKAFYIYLQHLAFYCKLTIKTVVSFYKKKKKKKKCSEIQKIAAANQYLLFTVHQGKRKIFLKAENLIRFRKEKTLKTHF